MQMLRILLAYNICIIYHSPLKHGIGIYNVIIDYRKNKRQIIRDAWDNIIYQKLEVKRERETERNPRVLIFGQSLADFERDGCSMANSREKKGVRSRYMVKVIYTGVGGWYPRRKLWSLRPFEV